MFLCSFIWRFIRARIVRLLKYFGRRLSIGELIYFTFNFFLAVCLSLIAPIGLRMLVRSNFVEHERMLDFTFKTCVTELAGVCSFPEAEFIFDPDDLQLQPGYYYSFYLDLVLFDTQQNRGLSVIMTNLQLRDDATKVIANYYKSIPIFSAFSTRSVISRCYTLARNLMFWPLYLIGFFTEMEVSDMYTVKFPHFFRERASRPARYIVVQLQNRFIQLSAASIRIRTSLSLLSFLINEYPITSYLVLVSISFCVFISILFSCYTFRILTKYLHRD